MANVISLERTAILAAPTDNCAMATRDLAAGLALEFQGEVLRLEFAVLEGHRFAVRPIPRNQQLLSWGLPFGIASTNIAPGEYVINQVTLEELRTRGLDLRLPEKPNFRDETSRFVLDERCFRSGVQVAPHPRKRHFWGYPRSLARGVGTRNYILLLGVSSRAGSFVRLLERDLSVARPREPFLDGIVGATHTEAGDLQSPNNRELLLRTLAGFVVHPNVAAVLVVDEGSEPISGALLRSYMQNKGFPLQEVPNRFFSLRSNLSESLAAAGSIVRNWLESLEFPPRSTQDLSCLKLALQCGGSDAFSGVSANPLAGWVAREIIRYGGCANLAETDELIGAESYVLSNVRDFATASRFEEVVDRFKTWAAWHGQSAEANLSGGNRYRGLYNITLKSIGAAMKRLPEVRIDSILEYAERMPGPGFHFMDSPGNDLESVAGQVASGCNLIFFTTGNGSVTNHPFVPTVKIVSTSRRFQWLPNEMDVDAGEYLKGVPMDRLGARTLDLTVEVASGQRTKGEKAGHWQVSIWRNWKQTAVPGLTRSREILPSGEALPIGAASCAGSDLEIELLVNPRGPAIDRIGLVLPNSLCSGQVARRITERLNAVAVGREQGISRFVALVHTEGCGVSSGPSLETFAGTLLGYFRHPTVGLAAFLEHGCEKTHNDFFRARLSDEERASNRLGFFSIQGDGGLEKVLAKAENWFREAVSTLQPPEFLRAGLSHVSLGVVSDGSLDDELTRVLCDLTRVVVGSGGTVIVPEVQPFFQSTAGAPACFGPEGRRATIAYGHAPRQPGFHVMASPTDHLVEQLTGLASCGVEVILAVVKERPIQAHPLVPVIQVTADPDLGRAFRDDLDLELSSSHDGWLSEILEVIRSVASREYQPRLLVRGYTDFQITRGLFGISL